MSTSIYCNRLNAFAHFSVALVAIISGTALVGWLFDSLIIASIHKTFIPMAPSTAFFFMILCGALLIHHRLADQRAVHVVASGAALFVSVTSAVIFADYFIHTIDLNIEGLIPVTTGKLAAVPMGRMSPISAVCFFLAGLALLSLPDSSRQSGHLRNASALLSSTVTAIGLVVFLGYLHGSPLLYGGTAIPVALPTAIAFIAMGMALCTSTGPDIFPQRLFLGDSIRSRLMRAFLPVTVAIVVLQGILGARYYSKITSPSLISSVMTLLSVIVVGFLITALSRIISKRIDAAESERKLAEQELSESEERFRAFFENSIDAMFLSAPDGTIFSANPEACRIFEMTEQEICLLGRDGLIEQDRLLHEALAERLRTGKYRGELTGRRRDGTRFPIEIASSVFNNKNGHQRISSTVRDVTQQKRVQDELRESIKLLNILSNTDPLTHLYNRRYLMDSLERETERLKRTNSHLTLLLFDVDHFKLVNDVFGHHEGDAVLVAIAKVAQELLRCNDIAARYGGEEFVLLLPETQLSGGVVVAERLREAVQAICFAPPMENLSITVSVGVATFSSTSVDGADSLLLKADEALYRAKNGGRNRVEIMSGLREAS